MICSYVFVSLFFIGAWCMRGQAVVIGVALFFIAMIIVGAVFLSLVSKTMKLLNASRREIELLTRKAKENLEVAWKFTPAGNNMYYPILVINNTGSIPVTIIRVHVGIREKDPSQYWWPKYYDGPWILQPNATISVGGSTTIKINHPVNLEQIKQWYRDKMTKILEARIVTRYGNVFRTIYVPRPRLRPKSGYNTILFYWSAHDWMDVENSYWWHGDRLGYYKMTAPDGAWSIDGGNIEIPEWTTSSTETISFKFMVYLPGTDSDGYILGSKNYLVLAVEFIDKGTGPTYPVTVYYSWSLIITSLDGSNVYSVSTGEIGDTISDPDGVPRTACFKLDPSNPKFIVFDDIHVQKLLGKIPKNIEPGWYIVELKIRLRAGTAGSATLGLKSVFLYISNKNLW